jgi:ABC-2 type transport system permease protein
VKALTAQTRAELMMTLRRGESLLLTIGIPVGLLVFFSLVDVLPTDTKDPVTFLAPGILALAVMSTAMVSLAIATGFERQYLVLKRLGATPLGRGRLLAAKTAAIVVVELLQAAAIIGVAMGFGWRPNAALASAGVVAAVLATVAFAGLGLLMAGTLRAEATLAGANGLYLLLLLMSGMVIPVDKLPSAMRVAAAVLPAEALAHVLHAAAAGAATGLRSWIVLAVWAVVAPLAAARWFRWE